MDLFKSNPKRKYGILTGDEIRKMNIINSNFNESSLKIASYDFRLGNIYYQSNTEKEGISPECTLDNTNGVLVIPKFCSIIITSKETVKLPQNIVGRFDLRVKYAFQGLILQVGPQLEPYSEGPLYGLLLNLSDKEILLKEGEELLTAEFSYLDTDGLSDKFKQPIKQPNLKKVIEQNHFKGNLATCFEELKRIDYKVQQRAKESVEMVNEAKKNITKNIKQQAMFMNILVPIFFTILLPFLCVYITKVSITKAEYPFEQIIQMQQESRLIHEKHDSLYQRLILLESKQNEASKQIQQHKKESLDRQ